MLCDSCHKREATSRLINIGGVKKTANLCDECFKVAAGALAAAQQRNARCEYCGAQPCAGGPDFLALLNGVKKTQFICTPCSIEHNRFIQEQMLDENPNLSLQEQVAELRKLKDKVDNHMKEWVSKRDSK